MLLAVMPAVALVVAAPAALAQGSQEFGQESKSGDVALENSLKDDAGRCAAILQAVNTSNVQNAQGVAGGGGGAQYDDDDDEGGSIEFEGSSLEISPKLEQECKDKIKRLDKSDKDVKAEAKAAPEVKAEAKAGGAEAKAGEAKAGGAEAKVTPAPKGEAQAAPAPEPEAKTEVKSGGVQLKELPRTGGASLLALGAGVLLAGGGLVARRFFR
jgi:LPXTG-motif cell wall-anchored protein